MKKKKLLIIIVSLILVIAVALPLALVLKQDANKEVFKDEYATTARQGYISEDLGKITRQNPEVKNEGLDKYPTYGSNLNLTTEQKNALIQESQYLCANGTWVENGKRMSGSYDKMDKNGYLYTSAGAALTDGNGNPRKLYKHTAANTMYYSSSTGGLKDDEKAVVKKITFSPRSYSNSYNVTGLYAPAGEVIKLEMSKTDFLACGGITIHIGQALYNGQANNIWAAKNINRMPVILNTMVFNNANSVYDEEKQVYTCYIGSFLGGPIYVRNTSAKVSVTFSGAVQYRHFILGSTTKEEFDELCKCSAPYFDLEVWDCGVLHSGPLYYAKSFSYDDLYKAAIFWEKVSLISYQVSAQGIVMIYDPFVAAGAAVAFPGRASTNCPAGWMENALNYKTLTLSGAWGVLHEYNHNYQGWGLPGGGEVTNNALNLAAYTSFTKISANRGLTASGETGLSGWNAYTSASWSLYQLLNNSSANQLVIYATLLHNMGAKDFVSSASVSGTTNYFNRLCAVSGYDMSYFFTDILKLNPGDAALNNVASRSLPKFVPVASTYQTGRSLVSAQGEKRYIKTMQPFVFNYGEDLTIDLSPFTTENGMYKSGTIVLPQGFSYEIKSISAPEYGSLKKESENIYTYSPSLTHLSSGEIYVTLKITKDDGSFLVDDVDLVLEFEQTHEKNKAILERTIYTYENNPFTTAVEAYESGYAGYIDKKTVNNVNPVQNSNTDIWVPNPANNAVMEVRGKLYIPTDGDYKIALRGRHHAALYISLDKGKTYTLAAHLNHNTNKNDWWSDDFGYSDIRGCKTGDWIYFKEVLLVDYNAAFVGLGFGRYEKAESVLDEEGNLVSGDGYNTPEETINLSYAGAYRQSYEFSNNEFTSDYLFTKNWTYTFINSKNYSEKGSLIESSGYSPWSGYSAQLAELFDSNDSNYIHSHSQKIAQYDITETNPFVIVVDLGKEIKANKMTIYGEPSKQYQPKDFVLYGGTKLDELKEIKSLQDAEKTGNDIVVNFDVMDIRYYKLVCTETYASNNTTGSKYISFRCIKFSCDLGRLTGCKHIVPDSEQLSYSGKWQIQKQDSTFGRVYVGEKGSSLTFTFTGTQFVVFSNFELTSGKFDVYIDGKLKNNNNFDVRDGIVKASYISDLLTEGEHKVKIVAKGKVNIDSILLH